MHTSTNQRQKRTCRTRLNLVDERSSLAAMWTIFNSGRISSTSSSSFRLYSVHSKRSDNRGMVMIWQKYWSAFANLLTSPKSLSLVICAKVNYDAYLASGVLLPPQTLEAVGQ